MGHYSEQRCRGRTAPCGSRRGGFTLIELLTVVAIIGLLVGMVVPTIQSVLEAMTAASTLTRIKTLSAGVHGWKMSESGNKYFPGQKNATETFGEGTYAGNASSFLASCLFGDYEDLDPSGRPKFPPPVDAYATYEAGMLDANQESKAITGVPNCILDTHSDTMPILYFVSRVGGSGKTQFVDNDNRVIYKAGFPRYESRTIDKFVDRGGGMIWMDGEFVLTAGGKEREYFGPTAIKNWGD